MYFLFQAGGGSLPIPDRIFHRLSNPLRVTIPVPLIPCARPDFLLLLLSLLPGLFQQTLGIFPGLIHNQFGLQLSIPDGGFRFWFRRRFHRRLLLA